jgi:hypothetical protein
LENNHAASSNEAQFAEPPTLPLPVESSISSEEFVDKYSLFQISMQKTVYFNTSEKELHSDVIDVLCKGYKLSMVARNLPPFISYVLSKTSVITRKSSGTTGK